MVTTSRTGTDITLPDGTTITSVRSNNERHTSVYDYTKVDGKYNTSDDGLQLCEHLYGTDLTKAAGIGDNFGCRAIKWSYNAKEVISVPDSANLTGFADEDYVLVTLAGSVVKSVTADRLAKNYATGFAAASVRGHVWAVLNDNDEVTSVYVDIKATAAGSAATYEIAELATASTTAATF